MQAAPRQATWALNRRGFFLRTGSRAWKASTCGLEILSVPNEHRATYLRSWPCFLGRIWRFYLSSVSIPHHTSRATKIEGRKPFNLTVFQVNTHTHTHTQSAVESKFGLMVWTKLRDGTKFGPSESAVGPWSVRPCLAHSVCVPIQ